jgi:hypothetical protein
MWLGPFYNFTPLVRSCHLVSVVRGTPFCADMHVSLCDICEDTIHRNLQNAINCKASAQDDVCSSDTPTQHTKESTTTLISDRKL